MEKNIAGAGINDILQSMSIAELTAELKQRRAMEKLGALEPVVTAVKAALTGIDLSGVTLIIKGGSDYRIRPLKATGSSASAGDRPDQLARSMGYRVTWIHGQGFDVRNSAGVKVFVGSSAELRKFLDAEKAA